MAQYGPAVIVIDTNILAYFWLPSDLSGMAEQALQKDPDWAAPLLWRSEFLNMLAGALRGKKLSFDGALQLLREAEAQMGGHEYTAPSDRVLELVHETTCSAYDCEFVALAQDLDLPLLTEDRQILTAFPQVAVSLSQFCA